MGARREEQGNAGSDQELRPLEDRSQRGVNAQERRRFRASPGRMGTLMQPTAFLIGLGFLTVGVLGFIPALVTNFDAMTLAGNDSDAHLLGVFEVSVLHNVVHLLFGVIGLLASRRWTSAGTYLIAGGVIYLLLCVYGLVVDPDGSANFVPLNTADNWLHLGLGVIMISLGLMLDRDRAGLRKGTRTMGR